MSENTNSVAEATEKSKSWFKGLKAEYRKVVWESREAITKQTIAVTVISIVLGLIIALIDTILQYGIDFLIKI